MRASPPGQHSHAHQQVQGSHMPPHWPLMPGRASNRGSGSMLHQSSGLTWGSSPELDQLRHAHQHLCVHLNELHIESLQVAKGGGCLLPGKVLQRNTYLLHSLKLALSIKYYSASLLPTLASQSIMLCRESCDMCSVLQCCTAPQPSLASLQVPHWMKSGMLADA